MSFETEAELSLTVDEGDLRSVRQQIEDGIGTTEVGVTDGGSMSAQSTGGSGGGRGARRSMRLAETRTDLLDDAVLYLESIDDAVSEGGLLGGGGGGGLFTELIGAGAETAGDVGVETGNTVADAVSDVLTGTVASTLGNTVSSAINGSTVAVEPNPLPVEGGGSGGDTITVSPDVRLSPTFKPTLNPDLGPDINLPDLNLGVPDMLSVDRTPLPVEREPLPVEDTGPIPVEDVGPISVRFDPGSGGGSGGGATDSSDGVGGVQLGGENGLTIGPGGVQFGGDNGITLGEDPGDPTGTQSGSATGGGARDISVTHSPTYSMEVDPRRLDSLADRIISEIEEDIERDLDALEDDVDELERELQELERDITR